MQGVTPNDFDCVMTGDLCFRPRLSESGPLKWWTQNGCRSTGAGWIIGKAGSREFWFGILRGVRQLATSRRCP